MLGTLLIILGAILLLASIATGFWLTRYRCATDEPSGCETGIIEQVSTLMIANEGIFFWLAWVIGVFLIWGGVQAKARAGRG